MSNSITWWRREPGHQLPCCWNTCSSLEIFPDLLSTSPKWLRFCRWHFQLCFREWKCLTLKGSSLKYVPGCLFDNRSSLLQVMVWCVGTTVVPLIDISIIESEIWIISHCLGIDLGIHCMSWQVLINQCITDKCCFFLQRNILGERSFDAEVGDNVMVMS